MKILQSEFLKVGRLGVPQCNHTNEASGCRRDYCERENRCIAEFKIKTTFQLKLGNEIYSPSLLQGWARYLFRFQSIVKEVS